MNSARVAGGVAPAPEHSSFPVPQSPVRQVKVESWVQWVLPQKRPPQEEGAVMVLDSSLWSVKPVIGRGVIPALDNMPGQTVCSHLLTSVNVADEYAVGIMRCGSNIRNRNIDEQSLAIGYKTSVFFLLLFLFV